MTTNAPAAGLAIREFGRLPDGRVVHEATLSDGAGLVLVAITPGGLVTQRQVPDRDERSANVALGFDDLADDVERHPHFGVIVSRDANRIAGASPEIDGAAGGAPRLAARLEDPASGRTRALHTTEPAIQVCSGNFLDGTLRGHGGTRYAHRAAICLEPQHSPDSPHHADRPSTPLRPGEVYRSRSVYRFGARVFG